MVKADTAALDTVAELRGRLQTYRRKNKPRRQLYESASLTNSLDIAVPPSVKQAIRVSCGFASAAIDTMEERMEFQGYLQAGHDDDKLGLKPIVNANALEDEVSLATLDSLIHGIGFAVVGYGDNPDLPVITAESVDHVTMDWDARKRAAISAIVEHPADAKTGQVTKVDLYTPGLWQLVDLQKRTILDQRTLPGGILPVTPFVNRPYASQMRGRSEISEPVRYYTEEAMRVMLRMSLAGELFSVQQLIYLGLTEEDFEDADGNLLDKWTMLMGRVRMLPRNEDGELPQVQTIPASSPTPHIEQLNALAQMLAGETGIPVDNLGLVHANPASADAISRAEARLVRRIKKRQRQFGRGWEKVARDALWLRDGALPSEAWEITTRWGDAATETPAAAADGTTKLVGAGILPKESQIVLDRIGVTPAEQAVIKAERQAEAARANLQLLLTGVTEPTSDASETTTLVDGA